MNAKIYNQEGKESGNITLPESVFGAKWNPDLVHGVVIDMQSNARAGTAHTKDRSEVRGGGRKPWRQKGTGRARHGSRRSPIWAGGGVTFGPRKEKDYSKKINKTVRKKALASTLSKKYSDGEIIFIDQFAFSAPKTADAKKVISALAGIKDVENINTKRKNSALVILSKRDANTEKSFQNFGNVHIEQAKDVNPIELLSYKYIVVADSKDTIKVFESRVASKTPVEVKEKVITK